jgi:hypothetical protein
MLVLGGLDSQRWPEGGFVAEKGRVRLPTGCVAGPSTARSSASLRMTDFLGDRYGGRALRGGAKDRSFDCALERFDQDDNSI